MNYVANSIFNNLVSDKEESIWLRYVNLNKDFKDEILHNIEEKKYLLKSKFFIKGEKVSKWFSGSYYLFDHKYVVFKKVCSS